MQLSSEPLRASEQTPESLRRIFAPIARTFAYTPCEEQDFLQEAVIKATTLLEREPLAPRGRIVLAGKNRILDHARAAARRRSVLPPTDVDIALTENGGGIREVEDRTFIVQVLQRLRPEEAQVLLLSAQGTMEAAAEIMGINVSTAKTRLYRARLRAREVAGLGGEADGKD